MPKYASFPKMGKCGKPRKIKEKPTYKEKCEHDKNTFRVARQKSECEPLGGLWRLKCGKSGQERQSVTTDLLLLRKEIVNNVKYSLGESSFRLLYCTDN